jgi:hypothetical protein
LGLSIQRQKTRKKPKKDMLTHKPQNIITVSLTIGVKKIEGQTVLFKEGVEILTEVPAGTLAQLCMWQLVVGQKL